MYPPPFFFFKHKLWNLSASWQRCGQRDRGGGVGGVGWGWAVKLNTSSFGNKRWGFYLQSPQQDLYFINRFLINQQLVSWVKGQCGVGASHRSRNRNLERLIVSHLLGFIKTLNIIYAHIYTPALPRHCVLFTAKHLTAQKQAFSFSCTFFSFDCSFLPHKVLISFALRFIGDTFGPGFPAGLLTRRSLQSR